MVVGLQPYLYVPITKSGSTITICGDEHKLQTSFQEGTIATTTERTPLGELFRCF